MPGDRDPRTAPRRLAWFVGLYGASLVAFTSLVWLLRTLVPH